jgi:CBS domain-containing protein
MRGHYKGLVKLVKVEDLMSRNIISASSNESLSSALAKMRKYKIHQMPVVDNGEYKGMLVLKTVVTKRIDPVKSMCINFAVPTSHLRKNMDSESAVEFLLNSGIRALPVIEKDKIVGILSESDLMKLVSSNKKAKDLMSECEYVSANDGVGKVRKMMTYRNISRVPVVSNGKLVGVIGTLNLIDVLLRAKQEFHGKGKMLSDRGYKEPQPLDKIKVETVMEAPKIMSKDASINDLAKILQKEEEVFVMNSVPCVIAQKDVLELLLSKEQKGVYVQVTNLHGEDSFTQAKIDSMTTEFVKKMGKMVNDIQSLMLHIERHQKGGKTKYSVRTRLFPGVFVSHSWDWDLATAAQSALDKLEKEVMKKHGKVATHEIEKRAKDMRP